MRLTPTFDCINLRGIKVDEGPAIRQEEICGPGNEPGIRTRILLERHAAAS